MSSRERPLSPHLQVYRWQIQMVTSILHRATGILLAFGALLIAAALLALMLSLAVGMDYSLFIVSRHRDQLASGMDAEESVARALATSGSAVVFAGVTVVIALVGMVVAGIPFLTVMGLFAALSVAIEVALALTLLPAMLGLAGERLRPRSPEVSIDRMGSRLAVIFW